MGSRIKEDIEHSEVISSQYIQQYEKDICPKDDKISYVDEMIRCSVHSEEDTKNEDGMAVFPTYKFCDMYDAD